MVNGIRYILSTGGQWAALHILVDANGLLMQAIVHAADVQDRECGVSLMASRLGMFPFLPTLYANSGYQGPTFRHGLSQVCRQVNVEIVKRSDAGRFVVPRKHGVVEHTIAWLNRCRMPAKDWERVNRNVLAFRPCASVGLMVRKPCQSSV